MPIGKQDLDSRFIVVDGNRPAGLALNDLLHEAWLIVTTTDPQGQPVERVLRASALTHVIESTPVDQVTVGVLPTKTMSSDMDLDDARAMVSAEENMCFVVKDANNQRLGILPPVEKDIPPRPGALIEVRCSRCGKWVFVPLGADTCPIYGHALWL